MNKVLRNCIPEITMSFLDHIMIKGYAIEEKDETMDDQGCRKFIVDHKFAIVSVMNIDLNSSLRPLYIYIFLPDKL